eukprot:CAMPEP_0203672084 /NCGR_PEP_ID=MMETSP0090-20130426/7700_1 /ASSEMBLY_ACC=CAM_ASM_001088 /TAXON_ID=426623 /ORGANISM="Chaetoceros affinis, Strain CCMP159" /LENGTH=434 /DNA_ID=CAMNT_0050537327 /DNA_START=130 /DNA_END=1434 /DNA_ORIENTATION=-
MSTAATAVAFTTLHLSFGGYGQIQTHRSENHYQMEQRKFSQSHYTDGTEHGAVFQTPFFGRVGITHCSKANEKSERSSSLSSPPSQSSSILPYKSLSKTRYVLYKMNLISTTALPVPRLLSQNDPIFTYHKLLKGLQQRQKDEMKLRELQTEINALVAEDRRQQYQASQQKQRGGKSGGESEVGNDARNNEDKMKIMKDIMERISEIAYGKGITPQIREDFLIKYGCTAYTEKILDTIIQYSADHGIIEVGAGNGQWAKALSSHHTKLSSSSSIPPSPLPQFIVAYDDMSQIPLNVQIYHQYTQPAQRYFFSNIQKMKGEDAVGLIKNRGRVLLLVYPPPGDMALDVVKQYSKFEGNDTIIYVGEGIGGANANKEFFDYFLNNNENNADSERKGNATGSNDRHKWYIMEAMDVDDVLGGGKGFEMMFVLKKVRI